MKYYVYRTGYNSANNAGRDGGPETVCCAEVEAENAQEACDLASKSGISCYNNQYFSAKLASEVEAERQSVKQRVTRLRD